MYLKTSKHTIFPIVMLLIGLLLFLPSQSAKAQKISVSPATVKVSTDQSFKLEYRVDDIQNPNIALPKFEDFAIVGGPNSYQSMQIVNGKVSQFQTISYVLQPRKAGSFTIQPAMLQHKGKTLKTNAVKVTVLQGQQQSTQGNAATAQGNSGGGTQIQLPKGAQDFMFLIAEADTNSYFMGEQITLKYNLYSLYDVSNYQADQVPTFTGFWVQDLTPQRINHERKMVNGQIYFVYPLKTYALFAQRSGEIELDKMNATISYREAIGGQNGFFQNYHTRTLAVNCQSSTIKVAPLPLDNKPSNFTGAVGKFGCSVKTDKRTCEVNEAISIDVSISGSGNLMLIEPQKLELPASFDAYEPEMRENIYEQNAQIMGSKTYEYVVVPTEAGRFTLPAISFSYFDPKKGEYVSIPGSATTIEVKPSTNAELNNKQLQKVEQDISDISLNTSLKGVGSYAAVWMPILGLLYLVPFALLPLMLGRKRSEEEELNDVVGRKRREALVKAQKRLEIAQGYLNKNDKRAFYTEMIQGIWGYIGDKLTMQTVDLSKENARLRLLAEGVDEKLVGELISTIEYCEMAAYAPVVGADKLDNTYNNTLRIIADIEQGVVLK